ncbi:MAG: hypothetical protein CSA70_02850 [Rhodobacterales bacterium]|nr:MAG: hypothetical protein CSA70_02850 [Rhodobacterales bacterium]
MFHKTDPLAAAQIAALVRRELHAATDERDLERRLERNGFGIKDTMNGRMLITLPQQVELFPMPSVSA